MKAAASATDPPLAPFASSRPTHACVGGLPQAHVAAIEAVTTTDVPGPSAGPGVVLRLENLPNPFKVATTIRYALPLAALVRMDVFDLAGRRVASPVRDVWTSAGVHPVEFRAVGLPSGLYLCRLQAGNEVVTRRMLVLR